MGKLKGIFKAWLASRFLRSVIVVAGGSAGAQIITLIFSPIITRLYGPAAFGVLGTFIAALGVLIPIAALAYPIAIVPARSDFEAKGVIKLSFLVSLIVAFLIALVMLFNKQAMLEVLGLQQIGGYIMLIPLAMLFGASQQIIEFWLIRQKKYIVTARVAVSQSLILNCLKVGAGFIHPTGIVLVFIATLGKALHPLQLWFGAKRWGAETPAGSKLTTKDLKELGVQLRDYPLYRAPQAFLSALSHSIPVLLLAALFGPASAGFYALSKSVLTAPATLVGNSVGNVFYQRAAELVNKGESPVRLLIKSSYWLFIIILLLFLVIIIIGPVVFSTFFGETWRESGELAQWMTVWLITSVAARPAIAFIPILKIQRFYLIFELASNPIKAIALLFGAWYFDSAVAAIASFSAASAISYAILFVIVLRKTKTKFRYL